MLNYIWAFMVLIGIIVAAFTGQMDAVSTGILDSSKEAVSLCILMLGVVGMWTGVMKIAEQTGLVRQLTKLLAPVLRLLFPRIADNEEVMGYIAVNVIANLLGLGWAATPSGIKAMKALKEDDSDSANDEMCMLMVINISSLQLIPINMIAYRMQYGSVHPGAILIPGLIATGISTLVGVGYGYVKCRKNRSRN
ncbi:MAG: nucleoside recognition protein [Lachnospiraceae bacterium]|nr:nucleoside recognition protein [Lachnospiraceae bacterium]MBR1567709.1 nucleoside recognition protein [Lachnospiraceae bacterium]